ncbi:hypothetical protein GBAR_LOCUS18441 [Geodia barretti]|uniref:Uncharacterized protein n=1 Tax=Geodia barretti TaxID=519541 RepID=A0AA35WSY5_GEOBA|nr:hypothetical protein GBAR_LOCUS18441 [Geodia barretti]
MWQMPREEWRLLCGPTERRRNPHTSSASLSLCPTSETESRCSNLLYWTPAEEREGFVKMCSSYLRSSTSLSESCGFSLKKKRRRQKAVVKEAIAMAKLTRLRICCAHISSLCQQSCTGQ